MAIDMQLCSSVSLSLSQRGEGLNKAGLIEASPPPSLYPGRMWEDKYFSSKEARRHLQQQSWRVTQGPPTSVKGFQVSTNKIHAINLNPLLNPLEIIFNWNPHLKSSTASEDWIWPWLQYKAWVYENKMPDWWNLHRTHRYLCSLAG